MNSLPLPEALVRYADALASHDVDAVAGTLSDQLAFLSQGRTLDKPAFLAMLRGLYGAFPDWRYQRIAVEHPGDGSIAILWKQGGTHTGAFVLPGLDPVPPTGRAVAIPPQRFFYRIGSDGLIAAIHPDPVPGGAPRAILEQIGITAPPL